MLELGKKYFLKENKTGKINEKCSVILTLENDVLSFIFDIEDNTIFSPFKNHNEDIWKGDVVEVFITFDGNIKQYLEYELSPTGLRFLGIINNPTTKSPILEKIDPNFNCDVELTDYGYKARIDVDVKGKNLTDTKLNCFNIDNSENGEQRLFALSPTLGPTFHDSNAFIKLM